MSRGLLHVQKPPLSKKSHKPTLQPPTLSTESLSKMASGGQDADALIKASLASLGFSKKETGLHAPSDSVKQRRDEPLIQVKTPPLRSQLRTLPSFFPYVLK